MSVHELRVGYGGMGVGVTTRAQQPRAVLSDLRPGIPLDFLIKNISDPHYNTRDLRRRGKSFNAKNKIHHDRVELIPFADRCRHRVRICLRKE